MALILIEGFSDDSMAGWDTGSGTYGGIYTSDPRVPGGFYGRLNSIADLRKSFTAASEVFVGFGLTGASDICVSFLGDTGTVQHISVVRNNTTGFLEIRRGPYNGTLLATGTTGLGSAAWNYIEISATISDTVGEVHVRLNGLSTDEVSYTGDTKNGGTNDTVDKVWFDRDAYVSDIYILDGTGSTNNTFLGDVAVRVLHPSGNGNSSQLTGSDSNQTDNYLLVDESPFSSSDYVGSATANDKDTYAMGDLPASVSTVYGMKLSGMMHKSDAGVMQSHMVLRSGGTDYSADSQVLTTTPTGYTQLYEQDPATTAAWTVSGINNMEAGMEVE